MIRRITDSAERHNNLCLASNQNVKVILSSLYVEMRDKVKIAVDLYLPENLDLNSRLPAILHQTRYFRRQKYRLLTKILRYRKKDAKREIIDKYVKNGYAYVNIDVRGSGASFGYRNMEWSPEEVRDGAEIVDWIIKQSWSDGNVAVIGMSYSATAAEMLLINNHPAVKAAVIQNSLFDVYTDILMPGGVRNESFLYKWSMLNKFRDMSILPDSLSGFKKFFFRLLINRAAPVCNNSEGLRLLSAAENEHKKNYDIYKSSSIIKFRDDINLDGLTLDKFSPHNYLNEIQRSNVPIYSWSGWYDGAYSRSAINRFININTQGSRLLIGPWDHGGNHTADPYVDKSQKKTDFDYIGEIILFLDCHLKKNKNIMETLPGVSYYTVGEGKWKFSESWPVQGFNYQPLFFNKNKQLTVPAPQSAFSYKYKVDTNCTSGSVSRWKSQVNIEKKRIEYSHLKDFDSKRIFFDSPPLKENSEITGHPVITVNLQANIGDFQLFVYLEEITKKDSINYVTEGAFRVIHRKISEQNVPYKVPFPCHTYKKDDALPLSPEKTEKITFDLLPISYLFMKGSKIRIAIAGADIDNFEVYPKEYTEFNIISSKSDLSYINLPANKKLEFTG